jgi:hypothetical protein
MIGNYIHTILNQYLEIIILHSFVNLNLEDVTYTCYTIILNEFLLHHILTFEGHLCDVTMRCEII